MRFVAGKGAVAELLLAWSRSGAVAGRGAVAERHREAAVGWGRYGGAVASRGAIAELLLAGDAMVELLLAGALQRSTSRV